MPDTPFVTVGENRLHLDPAAWRKGKVKLAKDVSPEQCEECGEEFPASASLAGSSCLRCGCGAEYIVRGIAR